MLYFRCFLLQVKEWQWWECVVSVVSSLQGGLSMGVEERPDLVTSAISNEAVTHTLMTPHTAGVLVTPTVPLEAVGVPMSSEVFQGYHAVPQQAINTTALHQLSAFPPEMPEGTTVSFIPQPSMAVGEGGQMDPHQMALGTAYMTAQLGQVRGEADQVMGEGSQTSMEHIPLTGPAPMCVPTPMGLTQGGTPAMTSDMHPGEFPPSFLSNLIVLLLNAMKFMF